MRRPRAAAVQAMAADGVRGDTTTLTALIRALGAGGLVDEALGVFRGMARARVAQCKLIG